MINIRLANIEDAETIARFQTEMAFETENILLDKETIETGVRSVFYDPQKGKYFVAEYDDIVVASLLLTPEWSDWRNKWVWWIQSVYVTPHYRGKKIFKKMYQHIKDLIIQDSTAAGLRLYVDLSNERARKVYQALGMNGEHYQVFEWMKEF
jgi:GNAT superfamily N-acetyltransferase